MCLSFLIEPALHEVANTPHVSHNALLKLAYSSAAVKMSCQLGVIGLISVDFQGENFSFGSEEKI